MNNFISVEDVPSIDEMIQLAISLKKSPYSFETLGKRKRIGIIFLNPSLRTRLSTQIAAQQLGLTPIVLNLNGDSWNMEFDAHAIMNGTSVENIADAAPILGNYFDILAIRTFPSLKNKEDDYNELVLKSFMKYAGVPIVSLESATLHPLQSLADAMTIYENMSKNYKPKVVLTWAPHIKALPQCVGNSFAQWMSQWDAVDLTITHPKGLELKDSYTKNATIEYDQDKALENADFIYVKNWSSYHDYGKTVNDPSWMLTPERLTKIPNAKVMHCLPVRRNIELSDAIIESNVSLIQEQAGNRVWSAQAVLYKILEKLNK